MSGSLNLIIGIYLRRLKNLSSTKKYLLTQQLLGSLTPDSTQLEGKAARFHFLFWNINWMSANLQVKCANYSDVLN